VIDVPLVARHPSPGHNRASIRARLGLPEGDRLALVSFGGYGVHDLPIDRLDCAGSWRVLLTERGSPGQSSPPGVLTVHESLIYESGLRYQDLIAAVDVVMTKPGYGIISDCIGARTPMLYTSRGRFAEYDVLVREMPRWLRCRFIALEDLLAGRWRSALDALAEMPDPPERPRTDGAAVIAGLLLDAGGR
jgi:hypothetical protein